MIINRALVFPLLFSFFGLSAQDVKKVTNPYGPWSTETYYVTKKDKIKQGPYTVVAKRGGTLISGFYTNGQRDSTWTYYGRPYYTFISKHYYKKGIKTGVWEFYHKDSLAWTYDFDSSQVHYIQPDDTSYYAHTNPAFQDENGTWIKHPPEEHVLPISSDYMYILQQNLQYPEEAQNRNQQGEVFIAVLVDEQGNSVSFEVGISSGYPSLDAEALRVVKLIRPEYVPARNNGQKVKSVVLLQVNFRLESQ
jgi:TonB family protein